jgi:cysteine desulfurase
MDEPRAYLDNNATTAVAPEVVAAMAPYFARRWGNPSSMHRFGGQVRRDVEEARARVAALINADPAEIVFTSGGTESNNGAIYGVAEILGPRAPIVTSRVEHPAVLGPCRHFRDDHGRRLIEIGVDGQGHLDLEALRRAVRDGPALVSLMWANNETGVLFPMDEVAAIVKEAGGVLHTDAVQAVGKVPVDVRRTPVDLLSFSGHKLHAPKGIGALYVRRGTRLKTFMIGGHQEGGRRGGTENVPYIAGLARACELAVAHLPEAPRIAALRDRLEERLLAACPDAGVNGDRRLRVPNTTNMSFALIEGEAILYHLSDLGICASSGSACSSGSLEPSHVIRAMGVPFTAVHGSIRFSLSRFTTAEEVDYVLEQMPRVVARLRAISPFVP